MSKSSKKGTISKIISIFDKRQRNRLWLLVFLSIVFALLELLGVSIILPLIKGLLNPQELFDSPVMADILNFFGIVSERGASIFVILSVIVVYVIKNIYCIFFSWFKEKAATDYEKELSEYMFGSYMQRGYEFFLDSNANELIQGINKDVNNVYVVVQYITYIISKALTLILIGAFLIATDWKLSACIVIAMGLMMGIILFVFKPIARRAGEMGRLHEVGARKTILESIQGIKDVISYDKQEKMIEKYSVDMKERKNALIRSRVVQDSPTYIIEMTAVLVIMCVLASRLMQGPISADFMAILAAFAVGAFRMMPAVGSIVSHINGITAFLPSLDVVYDNLVNAKNGIEVEADETKDSDMQFSEIQFDDELRMDGICYSYGKSDKFVIDNLNISIHKGESLAIIGESGSGKSTTVDLLLGLLKPKSGRILIDGKEVIPKGNKFWHEFIGYVPQNISLVDSSVKCNVAFGENESEIDVNRVREALQKADILDFVDRMPNGLDTPVGDRGVKLSGGQRQRIGIARALYRRPQVLILDEATSALDNDTEKNVMDSIYGLKSDVTLVIIAHRLSTIENCDRVVEIVGGKAVEKE